jgi:hypothetical protein
MWKNEIMFYFRPSTFIYHKGSNLLKEYGSIVNLLKFIYYQYDWYGFMFESKPSDYWNDLQNQMEVSYRTSLVSLLIDYYGSIWNGLLINTKLNVLKIGISY